MALEQSPGDHALWLVCGWCGIVIRQAAEGSGLTSTGMCGACQRAFERDRRSAASPGEGGDDARRPFLYLVGSSRRWHVTRGARGHVECRIRRTRDFCDVDVHETSVLHDGQPMYARTFLTRREAEREADDLLNDLLAAGWFPRGRDD